LEFDKIPPKTFAVKGGWFRVFQKFVTFLLIQGMSRLADESAELNDFNRLFRGAKFAKTVRATIRG
jgi:hypothetical protein